MQKEFATAYERVGDVLGYPYGANLGDSPGALQSYRKALAIRESLAVTHADDLPQKRGEFEAGERADAQEIGQAIARCHSALARAEASGNR